MDQRVPHSASLLLLEAYDVRRDVYAEALRRGGFEVVAIGGSDLARAVIADRVPRLIIASFDPQNRDDRFAFCAQLKADSRTCSVPIIIASVNIADVDVQQASTLSLLVLAVQNDAGKLVSAVKGVLAVESPRRRVSDAVSAA